MQLNNTIILCWIFCGGLTSFFAHRRGRHPLFWFFTGLLFGGCGLLMLFCFPKIRKQAASAPNPPASIPSKKSEAWLKMWYYLDASHVQQGPIEFDGLIKLWKENHLSEHSLIWGEEMPAWQRISDLPDVLTELLN